MPFIHYEKLNHRNCGMHRVRFVKSITRRPKTANVCTTEDLIIEARLHVFRDHRARRRLKKPMYDCRGNGWCDASHLVVFVENDKLYRVTIHNCIKEFVNSWLLKHIMKHIFRERK